MRLGVGWADDQYYVTDDNIATVLATEKYQNSWLTGLLGCINYVRDRINVVNMVEIGSYQGESTTLFAHYFKPKNLYAIDPFVNGYDDQDGSSTGDFTNVIYNFNLRIKQFPCIKHLRQFSDKAAVQFEDNSLDFVYVDGDHTFDAVLKDVKAYVPKVRVGGYIGGHDLGKKEITDVLILCFGDADVFFEDSSWLVQITEEHKRAFAENDFPGNRPTEDDIEPVTPEDFEKQFLKKHGRSAQIESTLEFFKYFDNQKFENVVEVHCGEGHTTAILAKYLNPDTLYAIDELSSANSQSLETNFNKNVKGFDCVKLLKYDPITILDDDVAFAQRSVDLVYISGNHENKEELKDLIALCASKIKSGGYLVGEGWGGGTVVNACLETIGEPNKYFDTSNWVTKL